MTKDTSCSMTPGPWAAQLDPANEGGWNIVAQSRHIASFLTDDDARAALMSAAWKQIEAFLKDQV